MKFSKMPRAIQIIHIIAVCWIGWFLVQFTNFTASALSFEFDHPYKKYAEFVLGCLVGIGALYITEKKTRKNKENKTK